jgi:hypothetical protein
VVGNNAGWNQIRLGQLSEYGQKRGDVANKLSPTRYDVIVILDPDIYSSGTMNQTMYK